MMWQMSVSSVALGQTGRMRWFWRVGAAVVGLVIGVAAGAVCMMTAALEACDGSQETSDSWICEGVLARYFSRWS